ncbi:hypothetical protein LPW26_00520 [Rhodopseudomonas sp. HC1]|uniref:hypothetical protein n=1 Tax=Rhodopseudomonas infernalis TaxID=2897386 RepID=UPI001EE94B89|nr:hypothetical protein [Rhodopseudomonas infernalis]MCG6203105.1 hypothetical protein [Rhodopseudomonas infernalis]
MNFSAIFHQFATWLFRASIAAGLVGVVYLALHGDGDMPGKRMVAAQTATLPPDTPCQPIGQTTAGELVYSMDCEALPGEPPALGAAASANGPARR